MSGETNLALLLREMRPVLNAGAFVFCTVAPQAALNVQPIGTFTEAEGVALILSQADADIHDLPYSGVWAWITLTVHSSLHAIGLLAAVSAALANAHLPANTVSGFYHDHLFVPHAERERVMKVLHSLQTQQGPHS